MSERIVQIQLDYLRLTVAYAPTAKRGNRSNTTTFYDQLEQILEKPLPRGCMEMVVGEFNARLPCEAAPGSIGKFAVRGWNLNSKPFLNFIGEQGLTVANSRFQHKYRDPNKRLYQIDHTLVTTEYYGTHEPSRALRVVVVLKFAIKRDC